MKIGNWENNGTYGFKTSYHNTQPSGNGDWIDTAAANYRNQLANTDEKYYAKIYFMEYESGTNLIANAAVGQNVIVTNPRTVVNVEKLWDDGNNADGNRPTSITVALYANYEDGTSTKVGTATLNDSNSWKYTFEDLPQLDDYGYYITYTIKEETDVSNLGYTSIITGDAIDGFTITNTKTTDVKIVKTWDDESDLDGYRPTEITVKLLADGSAAKDINGKDVSTIKITNASVSTADANIWEYVVTNLPRYNSNKEITYTIDEVKVDYYETGTVQITSTTDSSGVKVITLSLTNKHTPSYQGYTEITGKVWLDIPDGKATVINGTLDDDETGIAGIKVILKDEDGNDFDATSFATTAADGTYTIKVNYDNSKKVYKLYEDATTVAEKLKTAYVVFEYDGLTYTTVATAATGANTSRAVENETERNSFDSAYSKITSTTNTNSWNKTITASTQSVMSFETYTDTTTRASSETLKYCNGNGTYVQTNPGNAWDSIKTGTYNCSDANCTSAGHDLRKYDIEVGVIQNVNLGLFKREQPDVELISDIYKVEVEMNNQKYTYIYDIISNKYPDADIKANFQDKETYDYIYKRPINPSDIAYLNEEANKNSELMEIYVTYKVIVRNASNSLPIAVESITNTYDYNYKIESVVRGTVTDATKGTIADNGNAITVANETSNGTAYRQCTLDLSQSPIGANPLSSASEQIYIRYKVDNYDTIKGILNNEPTLNNAVEINSYSTTYGSTTLYAEQRTGGRTGNSYGGYDQDSHPGNANIQLVEENSVYRLRATDGNGNVVEPEDDTDIAPSFILCKDEDGSKTLAGTIWEDTDANSADEERLGNGYYEPDTEKNVQNVKVELYNMDGTLATLYKVTNNGTSTEPAVAYTDANGAYALEGVVTGEYFMKFTYGDDTTELANATTLDGGTTTVNARNYKSTIIKDSAIANILEKEYDSFTDEEKKWHITHTDGYSVAVDNMLERLEIEDLYYSNYSNPQNMTAYTKPFTTQVEFEDEGYSIVGENGEIEGVTNTLDKLDFGIAERPRENLSIEKTIENFKITLSNGQVLAQGNPNEQDANIAYTKILGFNQNSSYKRLSVEMDTELIQGAQLEVQYSVTVTNNNEIDYDYGAAGDYTDIVAGITTNVYDKYITKSDMANYYYYGNSSGLNEMKATIEFIDYLNGDIVYKEDTTQWQTIDVDNLYNDTVKLISEATKTELTDNEYKVLQSVTGAITLERTKYFTQTMYASKVLANEDDNTYDNNAEIIKIDGKTARTIEKSDGGVQIEKAYLPGNYVPSQSSTEKEQDDDRVEIIVTPGTGTTNYITTYVIAGLVGLIVMVAGVIFIKKKVLNK